VGRAGERPRLRIRRYERTRASLKHFGFDDDDDLLRDVQQQAATVVDITSSLTPASVEATLTQQYASAAEVDVNLEELPAPAQFDLKSHHVK
jgi:RNase adaptor protein for sRNA GlmZ degradation